MESRRMSTGEIEETSLYKAIYFFDEGKGKNKKLLGGKGAGLCEMTQLGLSVPPGFIITTEVCDRFYNNGGKLPDGLIDQVVEAVNKLEKLTGKKFGGSKSPLLISVRSGAAISMPGMMDTILNLGLNDLTVQALIKETGDERFAYDSYRRLIQLFGKVVLVVNDELFSNVFEEIKRRKGAKLDSELEADALKESVTRFREIVLQQTGEPFPSDPLLQLEKAINAVFKSWNGKRSIDYRREFKITPEIASGTAVTIVTMVFGNLGHDSATGVAFTRDPGTGDKRFYGEYLTNAQGEDVVAGVRTPKPIHQLKGEMPQAYEELLAISEKLERYYKEPQDLEFTIEKGRLYMLQTRDAKMNAEALVRTSVDMVKEGILTTKEAILRVKPDELEQMLHPRIDPKAPAEKLAIGINASPGAASGKVVFNADEAERRGRTGEKVILVREETKPEDVHGFFAAQGVLTSRGGKTSHAAVVARGMGKPCVVGCSEIRIVGKQFTVDHVVVNEGDLITLDGTNGSVYLGEVPTIEPEPTSEFTELLRWADDLRRLGVRANADTPEAAILARRLGAEGIGLCRTERMFNAMDRLPTVVDMILADTEEERTKALQKLLPLQKADFKEILRAMKGHPVTIRLLDPPLHEFLPSREELRERLEALSAAQQDVSELSRVRKMLDMVKALSEVNPMLGHRGVRVGITYPEIYGMQVKAIFEATAELMQEGLEVEPQIMVPQVAMKEELIPVKQIVDRVRKQVERTYGFEIPIKFGTMMEVVRACLCADKIAELADFFSFGTNDLTQGTFSFSREDAENKFLPFYMSAGILAENPFQTLEVSGVGRLMEIAVQLGRRTKPGLEIGICGEHGGDPKSIEYCNKLDLTYVSCSPYRIPLTRLAAAQASMKLQ